jgi:glycine cleavage system aminomethyltransferase T
MYAYEMKIEPLNINVLVSRCGYTGEDGFEISVKDSEIVKFCDLLLAN